MVIGQAKKYQAQLPDQHLMSSSKKKLSKTSTYKYTHHHLHHLRFTLNHRKLDIFRLKVNS